MSEAASVMESAGVDASSLANDAANMASSAAEAATKGN